MSKDRPDIRFEHFSNDWGEVTLAEVATKATAKNVDREYTTTLTNSAKYGVVSQRSFFEKDISNDLNTDKYYIVEPDSFVYNPRISTYAPFGPINRNRLGYTGIMSPLYFVFKTNGINTTFLEHYFKTTYWHDFMRINGDTGARFDRFSIKDNVFINMPIPTPTLDEQKLVGNLIDQANLLIDRESQRLIKLKQFKQSMLQKLFPRDGQREPEIRFEGFSGEWKELTLGKLVSIENNSRIPVKGSDRKKGSIPYYGANGIQDYVKGFTHNGDFILLAEDGANDIFDYPVHIISGKSWVNNHAHVLKPNNIDLNFLSYSLKRINFIEYLSGSGRWKLNQSSLVKISLLVTSYKEEQQAIGTFFSNFDQRINAQEKKLTKMKQFKQALLQKMFI